MNGPRPTSAWPLSNIAPLLIVRILTFVGHAGAARGLWPGIARKTDGEYAAGARHIPHAQRTRVRFDATVGDEETQTETRPVLAMLREGSEHLLGASWRQSATVVSDLDKYSPAQRIGPQLDLGVVVCELEGVLEK